MNEREKRDFWAGLSAEVDAELRGEPTRRTFIKRFGQMLGMIPLSGALLGSVSSMALAQAEGELADPSTPLGQAQAAAWAASTEGPKDGSAFRAAEAAKQFSGVTIAMTYEVGLQALDPRNFSGPMWEKLTGIKIKRGRAVEPRPVLQGRSRAHRRLGRLRRARHFAGLDAVARRRRRDRPTRRLHRQVHEHGGSRRLPPSLQSATDL